uniref:Putative ribonuclease H-like domain-containing protein n=1 Tax=Tanacetum cinerariifolium TaxID=118510 RepID=A0A699HRV4_TANCI|nr:putative ribonuclease H-like domain-containing protein [Tanacetum cinerariifolium]
MILNTLDHLGKFEEKGDEGYFIGYSMSSKAFWVFNKRTRRVEEKLHVEFLENEAIEKGAGPNWLFDIDSLTKSINYVPVDAGTISTNLSGIKDTASQEVKKDVSSLRYIALPNWAHDALLEFSSSTPQDHCSTEVPEGSENTNPTISTSNPPADHMETLIVETPIHTVSSPVLTAYSTDSQEPSSDARLILKRVANQEETPSLDNIISLTNRFEDILRGTTNSDESNEEEADISNMETAITASPTPTLRIHKDHPKSQIISPVDTPIQTRNKSKEGGEQSFIISDALQDPSWVEAMQEELLQFKIQNVWTLVDCLKGEERIDYDEVFAPVARIEAIRLFLAYASFMAFTVYQMDVKSAFLYGTIDEEVHQVTPKECHLHAVKMIFRYLKGHPKLGLWYPKESPFDLVAYSNSDYGGATQDRKSTTEGCQFLGRRLISWQCKKQTIIATSTTEAEYVAAASCYGQVLWIQNQLLDYGFSMLCEALSKEISSPILGLQVILSLVGLLEPLILVTARIETTEDGTKILTTVDGIVRTISESSLRRNLKLRDEKGISSLLDTELFENLTLMGYNISLNQKQYTRRVRIAQSSALSTIEDEPAPPQRDVSKGEACPTDSSFIADQDRAIIAKSSTLSHDSAPRVTSPVVVEGTLKEMVKLLEDKERLAAKSFGDDAPIKGRSMDEGEAATERISDDSEEIETVLTLMDAATVLASGVIDVPTGSRSIPTASTPAEGSVPTSSEEVPTASPVFATATVVTPVTRRKGKEVMVESETLKKQKVQEQIDAQVARELEEQLERDDQRRAEQIAKDVEVVRIHVEEELQSMIDGLYSNNETIAKYLQEYHQFSSELPIERRVELISLKEEVERIKRKGINLEQESKKKQKTSKEATEEAKPPKEVTKEKVYHEGQRSYWKITRLGGSSASYQFFVDLLKHLDREDLNQLWRLVKETLSNRPPTSDKEMELWVELNRMYEPDKEDQLWTHTQNLCMLQLIRNFMTHVECIM